MDRLRSFFSTANADALLVTHLPNVAYLCGFTGSSGILLVEASSATLFTDSRYTFQAREQVHDAKTAIVAGSLLKAVTETLKRRRGTVRLGYAPAQVSVAQRLALDSQLGKKLRWVDASNAVERLRAVKDAAEPDGPGAVIVFHWGPRSPAARVFVFHWGHPATRSAHDDAYLRPAWCQW